MKIAAVADTHTALWYLAGDPRLSKAAKEFIDRASGNDLRVAVSPISLVELAYLVEKGRVPILAYEMLGEALADPDHAFVECPFTSAVADSLRLIDRSEIPDMPDRILAATAGHLNVPIISRDRRIRSSILTTIWY
jgi:PIN domain nuclease of toxin-antitoxin system